MASAPSSTLHAKSITGRTSDRSPDFHSKVEFWWVDIPCSLARYSRLLAAAWSDGLYLTSWRRVALALPLASFMLGFLEGATHWSPLTIGSTHVSTSIPAVAFLQIYHLLFLAAALGALSAQLGLVLVTGFALGDYLIAGPYMTQWSWAPISGFLTMRVPMLLSYCMFFALAVMPTLFGRALLTPLRRRVPRDDLFSVILRVAASAVVQMLLVLCWIEVTPMVLRVMWSWVRQVPILGVSDYRDMLSPWLPLAASIGVVARAILVRRTFARADLTERMARLFEGRRQADEKPAWTRRLPVWLRAVLTGLCATLLVAGLVAAWWLASVVCAALVSFSLLRNCVLPASGLWRKWTGIVDRVPILFRITAASVATYYLSLGMLKIPGWSTRSNVAPGHFETVLACLGAGLLIGLVLVPSRPETFGKHIKTSLSSATSGRAARAVGAFVILYLFISGTPAYAICEDPACCFGIDSQTASLIAAAALIALILTGYGAFMLYVGAEAEAAAAAAAAEQAAAAAQATEALGLADTVSLDVTAVDLDLPFTLAKTLPPGP